MHYAGASRVELAAGDGLGADIAGQKIDNVTGRHVGYFVAHVERECSMFAGAHEIRADNRGNVMMLF